MKKLYALCLLTLVAVAADILYFRASPVAAQTQSPIGKLTIQPVKFYRNGDKLGPSTVDISDTKILGYHYRDGKLSGRFAVLSRKSRPT